VVKANGKLSKTDDRQSRNRRRRSDFLCHSFKFASRIDYYNAVLMWGSPTRSFGGLQAVQPVLHAAAPLISHRGVRRSIERPHHSNIARHTSLAACVSAHYLQNCADDIRLYIRVWSPAYFRDVCVPVVSVPFRSRLRSADNDDMIVPRSLLGLCVMVRAVFVSWNPRPRSGRTRCHASCNCEPTRRRRL